MRAKRGRRGLGRPRHGFGRRGWWRKAARTALDAVAAGETGAIDGWLAYGAALNEGRALFQSDEQFGQWIGVCQLDTDGRHERSAAMWAAANADDFATARAAGGARTVRGIH